MSANYFNAFYGRDLWQQQTPSQKCSTRKISGTQIGNRGLETWLQRLMHVNSQLRTSEVFITVYAAGPNDVALLCRSTCADIAYELHIRMAMATEKRTSHLMYNRSVLIPDIVLLYLCNSRAVGCVLSIYKHDEG
jgi:hypothetical protein